MAKVLFLCKQQYFITKMSRVRFHSMRAIQEINDFKWCGPGWPWYNEDLTVQENIDNIYRDQEKPDIVVAYKPSDMKGFADVEQKTCIRYNEMYDKGWTLKEINETKPDLIICHHLNDMREYEELFKKTPLNFDTKMVNIPHSAEKTIYYDQKKPNKSFDIMLVGAVGVRTMLGSHYPLRDRMYGILGTMSQEGQSCAVLSHPGGEHLDAYKDRYAKDFATALNNTKIAVTCTGVPNSRYGKYVEIPMCGTAIAGDIPGEDQESFNKFVIEINMDMSDEEIINKLRHYAENDEERNELVKCGQEWSAEYTQERYAERFVETLEYLW